MPQESQKILVEARSLTKLFGAHRAVDGIDFDIREGEAVGFLGPNGAGKTTTIRMLLNLLTPSDGALALFGQTFRKNKTNILRQMNTTSGTITLPGKLSGREVLRVFGDLYAVRHAKERVEELINRFDLGAFRDRNIYSLSTGQQVRVALAKAFVNRPRLLLLDEPTASLDPDIADRVRRHLLDIIREEGTTIFLTSHNMREVEAVCTRVLFLNNGRIEAEGTPQELARRVKRWTVQLRTSPPLQSIPDGMDPERARLATEDGTLTLELDQHEVGDALTSIARAGYGLVDVSIREPSLEDFFVHHSRKGPTADD